MLQDVRGAAHQRRSSWVARCGITGRSRWAKKLLLLQYIPNTISTASLSLTRSHLSRRRYTSSTQTSRSSPFCALPARRVQQAGAGVGPVSVCALYIGCLARNLKSHVGLILIGSWRGANRGVASLQFSAYRRRAPRLHTFLACLFSHIG